MSVAIAAAAAKYIMTCTSPSISSPTSLAKPMTWMRIAGVSCERTLSSTARESSYFARTLSSSTRDRPR